MIEEYKSPTDRKVRGANIKKGQILYAIRKDGLYFIWSYSSKDFAEKMDQKLYGPVNKVDEAANWRMSLWQLNPSDRTDFD